MRRLPGCRSSWSIAFPGEILYEVLYDRTGLHSGARRVEDPNVINECRAEIADLYQRSEPIASYFDREIAPLPPALPPRR